MVSFRGPDVVPSYKTYVKSRARPCKSAVAPCCTRRIRQLGQCKKKKKSGRLRLRKRKRLKCAHPGREMLLIYTVSPKVTEFWKSGLCGSFRLTLTQLNHFL